MAKIKKVSRVWIIPTEVAGFGTALQYGFNEIGYDAQLLNLSPNPYSYKYLEPQSQIARMLVFLGKLSETKGTWIRTFIKLISIPIRLIFVMIHFRRNTLVISLFGRSILKGFDLVWARSMGACVVTVFLGSDSRPPYLNGVVVNRESSLNLSHINLLTKQVFRSVRRAERNSDFVICSPSTAHFLRRDFINWFKVGMPSIAIKESRTQSNGTTELRPFRIVHAPSLPRCKGTEEIQRAISELSDEGLKIDFLLLQKMPNSEVRNYLQNVDLVIDELFSDTFMGGLGAEAVAAGTPFITFGYAEEYLSDWSEHNVDLLNGYSNPNFLKEKIRWAIEDESGRTRLTMAQSTFQRNNWESATVASRFLAIASGEFPEIWLYSPQKVNYFWGAGISKETLKRSLKEYINRFGEEELYLVDTTQLKENFDF